MKPLERDRVVLHRLASLLRRRSALRCALLAFVLLPACHAPPPARVSTPWGDVRAETAAAAEALAERFTTLRPAVLSALPGGRDQPTEVWLDPDLAGISAHRGVAALTQLPAGRIRLRGTELGIGADFLLVHELVHVFLGPDWDPLPAIMKEGLCDALACRLVPPDAPLARALRLFGARFAFGDQEFVLAQTSPSFGVRRGARIRVAAPPVERRLPLEALALHGRGVTLHGEPADEDVLYGYGLLAVERAIERIGLEGLHELCLRATAEGHERVPEAWVLWAAGLSADPAAWEQSLASAFGEDELRALSGWLAEPLAAAIAGEARLRLGDLDGETWLSSASLSLGLRGTDLDLPLAHLPELRAALLDQWAAERPAPLRTGQSHWRAGDGGRGRREGVRIEDDPHGGLVITFAERRTESAGPRAEAVLRFGRDERGCFLTSALPDGFADFRVLVHGVVVADLGGGLNVQPGHDETGWTRLLARLDPGFELEQAVLFDAAPNVVVLQRGGRGPAEQRIALHIPLAR